MTAPVFEVERSPFPRWWGPFSPARGTYSGFRFHQKRLGTWVENEYGKAFWALVDSPGVAALARTILQEWHGGRVLLLPNGLVIKPLQGDLEVGQRVLVGRFRGPVVLERPDGRSKIVEFVGRGEFGIASGGMPDGSYERLWFRELVLPDEVAFESNVFLLRKATAEALKAGVSPSPIVDVPPGPILPTQPEPGPAAGPEPTAGATTKTLRLVGTIPPELWNRLGTKILPKLRSGTELKVGVEFSVTVRAESALGLASDLRQILQELGLAEVVRVE